MCRRTRQLIVIGLLATAVVEIRGCLGQRPAANPGRVSLLIGALKK